MRAILFQLHCASNAGYAIDTLERRFLTLGNMLVGSKNVHFGYPRLNGRPEFLATGVERVIVYDPRVPTRVGVDNLKAYLLRNGIDTMVGFDQPPRRPGYLPFRQGGIRTFVSYYGAPMGTGRGPLGSVARRLKVALSRSGPDHYVFESKAMAEVAVHGQGIRARNTSVVPLGVDTHAYRPDPFDRAYLFEQFSIPHSRRVVLYSGTIEGRKGIAVLMDVARLLVDVWGREDVHILVVGNRSNTARSYLASLAGSRARMYVTFGGYRKDVARLLHGVYCGVIPSTGWDSFTQSSVEMAAAGVPVLVSDVGGLPEAVVDGVTGRVLPAGDVVALATAVRDLVDAAATRDRMALASRAHAVRHRSQEAQLAALANLVREVAARRQK